MNKKFLLALAGVVLSLGSSAALQAQEVTAGLDVGYRQTTDHRKYAGADYKVKDIKHLLLKAHLETLFDNQVCVGGELRYGFAMGKAKLTGSRADGTKFDAKKLKNKSDVFEGDVGVGYHIAATDGFSIVPVVGYQFQRYQNKFAAPFRGTAHSPFAGVMLVLKPSDEFTIRAKGTYGWPKMKRVNIANSQGSLTELKLNKRCANWKASVGFDYAVDESWDLALDLGYNHLRMKHKKINGVKASNKLTSWDAALGATYRF